MSELHDKDASGDLLLNFCHASHGIKPPLLELKTIPAQSGGENESAVSVSSN